MKSAKTNPRTESLVAALYKAGGNGEVSLWKTLAKSFEKPRQSWAQVNLGQINRVVEKDKAVLVPGKVLGAGDFDKKVEVYAYSASESAKKLIKTAGGSFGTIEDAIKKHPKATGVRLLK